MDMTDDQRPETMHISAIRVSMFCLRKDKQVICGQSTDLKLHGVSFHTSVAVIIASVTALRMKVILACH